MKNNLPLRVIPVWLRVLAAVVAAAAAFAIFLVIRGVPGQVVDVAGFIRLGAEAILFLCVAVLFGYVAATGLPPAHLWRQAGHMWWPAQPQFSLTPDMHRFLAQLRARHPQIRECWVLEAAIPGECWFIACAEPVVQDAMRGDWDIRRKDVRLYLLNEASRTVTPAWGRSIAADFTTWDWEPQGDELAEFRCPTTGETRNAQRVWG
ncbi:MAG: hypothetical protein E4H19_08490 [Chromatiales bacterium]|jgi:hypothetical protein|nr:MAG: hypothetical protein E4H19_08490 [Chromatiales bacterium]